MIELEGCVVEGCPMLGTDRHHVMPRALRGHEYADRWPVIRLCPRHHKSWHALVWPGRDAVRRAIREAKAIRELS